MKPLAAQRRIGGVSGPPCGGSAKQLARQKVHVDVGGGSECRLQQLRRADDGPGAVNAQQPQYLSLHSRKSATWFRFEFGSSGGGPDLTTKLNRSKAGGGTKDCGI